MTSTEQTTCPHCHKAYSVRIVAGQDSVCSNCGAKVDKHTLKQIPPSEKKFYTHSSLKLGLKGILDEEELEIVGYIRYEGRDTEGLWQWEEWFSAGKNGYLWLRYDLDEKTYALFKQLDIPQPIDLAEIKLDKNIALSPEERFKIQEIGKAKIVAVAGKVPWKADVGDVINYADGNYYRNIYTLEWSKDEVEIYKGKKINEKALFTGLHMHQELAELIKKKRNELKWDLLRVILWLVTVASFTASLLFLGNGKVIYSQKVTVCPDEIPFSTNSLNSLNCIDTKVPLGPINLTNTNRVYKIHVDNYSATHTNWVSLDVNLLNATQQPVSGFEGDFWVEDWHEDGQSGTEANYKAEKLFRLTEPGQYFLDMEADKQNPNNEIDTFNIKITEDTILVRYFILLGLAGLLILGIKDKWLINN